MHIKHDEHPRRSGVVWSRADEFFILLKTSGLPCLHRPGDSTAKNNIFSIFFTKTIGADRMKANHVARIILLALILTAIANPEVAPKEDNTDVVFATWYIEQQVRRAEKGEINREFARTFENYAEKAVKRGWYDAEEQFGKSSYETNTVRESANRHHGSLLASAADIHAETPKPYVGPSVGDPVWERTEKEIGDLKAALKKQGRSPQVHYLLGIAYHQRGNLKEAKAELQIALNQDPRLSDGKEMLSIIDAQIRSIEGNLGQVEKDIEKLSVLLFQKGASTDEYGNSIKGSLFQTKSYLATLRGIAEGKIRIYVTTEGKTGMLMMGGRALALWKGCLASYGARLQWNYKDNFEDRLIALLTAPEGMQAKYRYSQIREGLFKGALADKDQKVVIPGVRYYQDTLLQISATNKK